MYPSQIAWRRRFERFLSTESASNEKPEASEPSQLELLRDRIEKHVSKSLQEYLQILPQYACTVRPKLVTLVGRRRAQHIHQDVK